MCSSARSPAPMHVAAEMFTPASLIAAATCARAPGVFSMSITRSTAMSTRKSSPPARPGAVSCVASCAPMSAITHLLAGMPVSDLDASIDWYTRFFGRHPDMRAGDEVVWDVDEHASLFIEPNAARAGAGWIIFPDPDGNAIAFAEPSDAQTT